MLSSQPLRQNPPYQIGHQQGDGETSIESFPFHNIIEKEKQCYKVNEEDEEMQKELEEEEAEEISGVKSCRAAVSCYNCCFSFQDNQRRGLCSLEGLICKWL